MVKKLPANARDVRDAGSVPGPGRSPRGEKGNSLSILPGESHRQGSLMGYSPWGPKELDTSKHLSTTNRKEAGAFQ